MSMWFESIHSRFQLTCLGTGVRMRRSKRKKKKISQVTRAVVTVVEKRINQLDKSKYAVFVDPCLGDF